MKRFKDVLSLRGLKVLASLVLLLMVACVDSDADFANGYMPDSQTIDIQQSDFQWVNDEGEQAFSVRLYQTNDTKMSNVGSLTMGAERDSLFGLRLCGFYSQFTPLSSLEEEGFGIEPMLDSVMFYFNTIEYRGDTTQQHTYEVREILNDDFVRSSSDTLFGITSWDVDSLVAAGILGEIAFEFRYPDDEDYLSDGYTDSIRVDLITDAGLDLMNGLMLKSRNDGTLVEYDIYNDNNETFVDKFKGFYVMPKSLEAEGDQYGATYNMAIEMSGFGFYGRSKMEYDTSLIEDTISMSYVFYDESLFSSSLNDDYASETGGVSINIVERDYTYAAFSESVISDSDTTAEQSEYLYIEGIGGVASEITLEKALFENLDRVIAQRNLDLDEDFSDLVFNAARMQLYAPGLSSYSAINDGVVDVSTLLDRYDRYPTRLGMYSSYGTMMDDDGSSMLVAVLDYNYYYEITYGVYTEYSGLLNRGFGCYEMNIQYHMQAMWQSWQAAVEEAGGDSSAVDWDSITWNKIYVAPLAENFFSTKRIVLQGNPSASSGDGAPIRFLLTYSLVKSI